MGILGFPTELLLLVAENLSLEDLIKFRSTSKRISLVLTPFFQTLWLQNKGELTALQWAAVRGHADLIELAISNGAKIDEPLQGKLPASALSMSDWSKWWFIYNLANYGTGSRATDLTLRTPLYLAACSGRLGAIRELLKLGASMKCRGGMDSPASVSAYRGDVDCMRAFISARFDINTRGLDGTTILHQAIFGGVEMVKYLLQLEGVKKLVNSRCSNKRTPLHWAMDSYNSHLSDGRRVMTEVLLQHGADIHARDHRKDTPTHIAARVVDVNIMRLFTAAGIDFDARGASGQTILHCAVGNRAKGLLEHLLGQEGGRRIINIRDNHGDTPLDYAVASKDRDAVRRLVKCGAIYKARTSTNARRRPEFRPLFDVV